MARKSGKSSTPSKGRALRIIPIGGMGEIGKNMFAFEYEDEILLVDGGLAFPDADMLGVDILVPRIDWVLDNIDRVKGWVLTHGHEDHIGGLPFMLKQLPHKIPMYGAKLTLGLLRGKFEEFRLKESDVDLHEISTDERIKVSKFFTVDYFRMTHSIPDNSGLIIHTPIGRIVHSGDFKLDYNPADGKTSHLHKLAQAGEEGVLALISDSTNAERPGYTPSEKDVMAAVDEIVAKSTGRIIVTTFSSHVHRIQNFVRVAEKYDRRVVVEGALRRSRRRGIAQELGYLEAPAPCVRHPRAWMTFAGRQAALPGCTGSQGQADDGGARAPRRPQRTSEITLGPAPGQHRDRCPHNPDSGQRRGGRAGHQPALRLRRQRLLPADLQGARVRSRQP
ncbi:MAG: ribonuclease J [Trueperaceae bacterium]|nr:ribonuclease J [Trueperaceae bacterium]